MPIDIYEPLLVMVQLLMICSMQGHKLWQEVMQDLRAFGLNCRREGKDAEARLTAAMHPTIAI